MAWLLISLGFGFAVGGLFSELEYASRTKTPTPLVIRKRRRQKWIIALLFGIIIALMILSAHQ
jgi:hypothetical protein